MRIAFQPVVVSKSNKSLPLSHISQKKGKGAVIKTDCSFTGV